MTDFQSPANLRQLPIVSTIRRAWQLIWMSRAMQGRLALPGFVMLTAGMALPIRAFWGLSQEDATSAVTKDSAHQMLPWLVALMFGSFLTMSFGAAWRRFLLLDLPPTVFTFDAPFRRYLTMLVMANFAACTFLLLLANAVQIMPGGLLILVAGLLGVLVMVMRYILLFTAALADNHDLTPRGAARMMQGNLLRYTALWCLLTLSIVCVGNLLTQLLLAVKVSGATIPGAFAFGAIRALTLVGMTSLTSSLAALAYDFIVRGGGPAEER